MSDYYTPPADVLAGVRARSTKINEIIQSVESGFDELPTDLGDLKSEVIAARDGEATLLAQIDALQAAILAVDGSNGSLISSNDSTPGFLNGKLLGGTGITLTEGNDGGNETLTISADSITWERKTTAFTATVNTTKYKVDAGVTVTLPGSPSDNDQVWFVPLGDMVASNATIARNGKKIMGESENMTWNANVPVSLIYDSTLGDWRFA